MKGNMAKLLIMKSSSLDGLVHDQSCMTLSWWFLAQNSSILHSAVHHASPLSYYAMLQCSWL